MITRQFLLDKYKKWGLVIVPLKDTTKKPESKFTGRYDDEGKQIWSWKYSKGITYSDKELLAVRRWGVDHEASDTFDADFDDSLLHAHKFIDLLPDTFTIGKKYNGSGIPTANHKLFFKPKDVEIKTESYGKITDAGCIIELLPNTQSHYFGDRDIINDIPPKRLTESEFQQVRQTTKEIYFLAMASRNYPPKGQKRRDEYIMRVAGVLVQHTDWNTAKREDILRRLLIANNDTNEIKNRLDKIKKQENKLKEGKDVYGIPALVEFLGADKKAGLDWIDAIKPEENKNTLLKPLVTYGLGQFIERIYPPIIYYLYPLSSTEQLVQLFGLPGEGKTLFAVEMGWCESQGLDFMDFKFNKEIKIPPPVLYVEGEMSAAQLQERICKIIDRDKDKIYDLNNFEIAVLREQPNENFTKLIHEEGRKKVELSAEALFKRRGVKPIIYIDNIRMLMGMFDEKDSTPWIPFIGWLGQMRARGYTVKFLHHSTNTGEKASGSGLKEANLNLNVQLSLPKDDELLDLDEDHFTQIKFKAVKWREVHIGWQKPFIMSVNKETMEWKKHPLLTKTQRKIKVALDSGKDVKDIIDPKKEGFSKANVYKVVKILKGGK